jgi:hypothetical protein
MWSQGEPKSNRRLAIVVIFHPQEASMLAGTPKKEEEEAPPVFPWETRWDDTRDDDLDYGDEPETDDTEDEEE